MKKTALFLGLILVGCSLPAVAENSVMTDEELARVVCNHVEQSENSRTAIAKAYGETKNIINSEQKNTLKNLVSGTIDVEAYCAEFQN